MSYTKLMELLFGAYRKRSLSELLLHPGVSYHVRELARRTGTSAGTLHKELKRLAQAGLLLRQTQGNQVRYQANRDCPVFPELASLFRKTTGLVDVLADALAPLAEGVDLAFVFGSLARGDETATSDIDLYIVGKAGFGEVVKALHPAQDLLRREINPVIHTPAEVKRLARTKGAFLRDILAKPTLLIRGSANDLAKLAGDPKAAGI